VGLDTLRHVAANLYENVPDDESRDMFGIPRVLNRLVEEVALGAKTKAGFYRKEGNEIKSINPESGAYESARPMDLGDLNPIQNAGSLAERLRALYADPGRAGAFFRQTTHNLLGYSARRIPEIADRPADIDRAMQWGFGWELGPFGMWDALGFETVLEGMKADGIEVPEWVQQMRIKGADQFYLDADDTQKVYVPAEENDVRL
jgi:3-hydroxyacyl-CoA dehydrogenase